MKGLLKLIRHRPRINLCSSHLISTNHTTCLSSCTCNKIPISHSTTRTNIHHNNHTRREGVAKNSEEEVEEEDLVEEEVKLHAITVDNQVTMPEIV